MMPQNKIPVALHTCTASSLSRCPIWPWSARAVPTTCTRRCTDLPKHLTLVPRGRAITNLTGAKELCRHHPPSLEKPSTLYRADLLIAFVSVSPLSSCTFVHRARASFDQKARGDKKLSHAHHFSLAESPKKGLHTGSDVTSSNISTVFFFSSHLHETRARQGQEPRREG